VSFFELRVPPVAMLIVFGLSMWVLSAVTPTFTVVIPWRAALVIAFALVGLTVGAMAIAAFRRARTTVNPSKPIEASAMITSGVYRVSRNPMYLGLLLVLFGWATALSNPLAFALLPAFVAYITRFQISPEERALFSKFGSEFVTYKESVRRWL